MEQMNLSQRSNEDVREEVTPAKIFTLEKSSKVFPNIECVKVKRLKVDSNLERNVTL